MRACGLVRVVSGGQTGVDRAALDAALACGLPCGGWCPRGRRAEDGPIDPGYPLRETPGDDYAERTEWNVRDSDATLVLVAVLNVAGPRESQNPGIAAEARTFLERLFRLTSTPG
jgi:hypothetical protein